MFAVLKTGGKQYRVRSGDVLRVEKLAAEAGETVQFNDILMLGGDDPVVGAPLVADACVKAEVVDQIKGDKVIHFVRRRRKHSSKRTKGHRQQLTLVRITEILAEGAGKSGKREATDTTPAAVAPPQVEPEAAEAAPAPAETAGMRPGNLLEAPRDGGADDLKRLTGVGPKLETLLNENGVYHFDQIAEWSEDEVAWMDEQLSFKGRISRDDWIGQAASLAADKE